MRTPGKLPSRLNDVFSVRDAKDDGVGVGRLRGADLKRPFRGTRALPETSHASVMVRKHAAFVRRVRAYATIMPAHAFFAGTTAALLHGIPLPPSAYDADLFVAVPHPCTPPRRAGIRGCQIQPHLAGTETLSGLAVTDVATTWAMLAGELDDGDLVAAADHLLRIPRHPGNFRAVTASALATREDLAAAIGRRRGAGQLRAALARARVGASSRPETRVRLILVDAGLPEPELDYDVYDSDGWFVGCLDMAYPGQRVGVEYDGAGHMEHRQFEHDVNRLNALAEAGWRIVRVTSRHIFRSPGETVRRVSHALHEPFDPRKPPQFGAKPRE